MKKIVVIVAVAVSSTVFAQGVERVQRSSSPRGVQIQGESKINASAQNTSAVAAGEGNAAKNATGAVRGNVQIQGNTRINANATNVNAVATGKGNAAANDVGTVGGK